MITVRRALERHHQRRRERDVWLTFCPPNRKDPFAGGFGNLENLDEDRLQPGASVPHHPRREAEILTYVHEGALAHQDSMGRSGVLHAGEFQRMTAARGIRHCETNASRTDCAHIFQIWLRPPGAEIESDQEQRRFCVAERRGVLCLVASPDGRRGSLRIHQDARLYSAVLEAGQHVAHELSPGRGAWLHVVRGEASIGDVVLRGGDGAGITAERAVSITARDQTEILLLDLARPG